MNEGAPKSIESSESLQNQVKSLENKIKGSNWHKRIAYALAVVAGLGFAAEKIDNTANENAKKVIREKIERIKQSVDLLEVNNAKPGDITGLVLDWHVSDAEDIESILDHSDKNTFERMVSSAEAVN